MATDAEFDTSEMKDLIVEFDVQIPVRLNRQARGVVKEALKDLNDEWRDNALMTEGAHGKNYHKAISHEQYPTGLSGEVGPEQGTHGDGRQGGMGRGFEFGSRNQTRPHLDGTRAADMIVPRFARRVGIMAEDVFRPVGT